jgi:hypothetical protein
MHFRYVIVNVATNIYQKVIGGAIVGQGMGV